MPPHWSLRPAEGQPLTCPASAGLHCPPESFSSAPFTATRTSETILLSPLQAESLGTC